MSENQNVFQTPHPTCPHCGHELDDDEMLYGKPTCDEDLYALAPNEGSAVVQRPRCDQEYAVKGGYRPHYTSAFCLDEL
jgi:predicted  nucleic acid-binding Zn-ribbon protein